MILLFTLSICFLRVRIGSGVIHWRGAIFFGVFAHKRLGLRRCCHSPRGFRILLLTGVTKVLVLFTFLPKCVTLEKSTLYGKQWKERQRERQGEIEKEREGEIERVKNIETKREGQGDREEATEGKSETERKAESERG